MMTQHRFCVFMVVSWLLVASHLGAMILATGSDLQPVWQMFREQLFSNIGIDGGPRGVEQLLNRMKDLLELNENTLEDGLVEEEKVDTLLDACDADNEETVCQLDSLSDLNRLIEYYSFGPMTLHDYLEKCRRKRFDICQTQLIGSVRELFEQKLDPEVRANLIGMKNSIYELSAKQNRPMVFPMFPSMTAHDGLLNFLEQTEDQTVKFGKSKFRKQFRKLVMESCDKFLDSFDGAPLKALAPMLEDGWICEQINKDTATRDLLTVNRMCAYLERDISGHTKRMYKLAKERRKSTTTILVDALNQAPT